MTDWRDSALCLQIGPADLWHPEKGDDNGAAAKRICRRCEVQTECLNFALEIGDDLLGIFGGTSRDQRRKLRKDAAA